MLKEEVEVFPVSHKYCFAYFILVEKNGSRTFKNRPRRKEYSEEDIFEPPKYS